MPVRDDVKSGEERRELIDGIMFMPAVNKRPVLLVPCPTLHITVDEVCSGDIIFCAEPLHGYYRDLLPHGSHDPTTLPGEVIIVTDCIL